MDRLQKNEWFTAETKPSTANHSFDLNYCSIEEQMNIMKQKLFNNYRHRSSLIKQNMVYKQNMI